MNSIRRKFSKKPNGDVSRLGTAPTFNVAPPTRRPGSINGNPFQVPPPAYTPSPSAAPTERCSAAVNTVPLSSQATDVDDAYSFLRTFDTIFLIDDSGSMAGSRWREAADALATVTPVCTSHDADGIDLYFFNHPTAYNEVRDAASVREIFESVRPGGGTPTGQRLRALLTPYLRRYETDPDATKPINVICITDGDASDDVESPLVEAACKLDRLDAPSWQVGVQFFQIGNDPEATELLKYLDDELATSTGGSSRDMVDTVPFRGAEGTRLIGDGVLKVVLGSVNRRLDRRRTENLHG